MGRQPWPAAAGQGNSEQPPAVVSAQGIQGRLGAHRLGARHLGPRHGRCGPGAAISLQGWRTTAVFGQKTQAAVRMAKDSLQGEALPSAIA